LSTRSRSPVITPSTSAAGRFWLSLAFASILWGLIIGSGLVCLSGWDYVAGRLEAWLGGGGEACREQRVAAVAFRPTPF